MRANWQHVVRDSFWSPGARVVCTHWRENWSVSTPPRCTVLPLDLGRADAAEALADAVETRGLAIDILVNNAGFGLHGEFDAIDPARERAMLELDIITLTALTHRFAPAMKTRGWGRILLVSSIGAYQPSPTYAAYAAAKSYVLMYAEVVPGWFNALSASSSRLIPRGLAAAVTQNLMT